MHPFVSKYFLYYPVVFLTKQNVPKYLTQLKKSQWYNHEQLQQIQLQKLIKLLEYAKANISYYQKTLKNIEPGSISSLVDMQQIPILTKELLKENFKLLVDSKAKGALKKTTSGSTGSPITIYKTAASDGAANAAYWRGYEWAGVKMCDRQGRFWGIPHDKKARRLARLTDLVVNRLRFSTFSYGENVYDEKIMTKYFNALNRFKPQYLYGYVSMLEAFARYLLKNNLKLKFRPTCVITTAEVLTILHRSLFEKAFNCKVFNEYGCGEIGTIAHECEHGSMHISAENLIVEVIQNGKPVNLGETGEVVVTELNNTVMPLIRYNLKDLGYLSSDSCPCGRELPILEDVVGRTYDTIYNREGKAFYGAYFTYIFKELHDIGYNIAGFQIIQIDYENLTIKVVMPEKDGKKLEDYITRKIHDTYGRYTTIKFDYVSKIDREISGKIRLVKSLLRQ